MTSRLRILNIWVDPVDMAGAKAAVREWVETAARPHTVLAVNPEKNFSVPAHPALPAIFQEADLLIPDGIGLVLAARLLHGKALSRVAGADLMEEICRDAAKKGDGVFFFGSSEETSRRAVEILAHRYQGLVVAGRQHGFLTEEEMPELIRRITESGAKILFAGLGSPRQELWWARYGGQLTELKVFQGIGGTLDTVAGKVRRAPKSWQKVGLEWLYRLLCEPRRIARQKALPLFAGHLLAAWGRQKVGELRRLVSSVASSAHSWGSR